MKFEIDRVSTPRDKPVKKAVTEVKDGRKFWTIEFETLKELVGFSNEESVGDIILSTNCYPTGLPDITIYDGYIE